MQPVRSRKSPWLTGASLSGVLLLALGGPSEAQTAAPTCQRQLTANVVALDQVFFYNRLGAVNPGGMIYALRRDVVDVATGKTEAQGGVLSAGHVALRPDKRPRPLILRMNIRDCLTISFQNLLNPARVNDNQPITRNVGLHVTGMQLVTSIADDGSNVGANASSLAAPAKSAPTNSLPSGRTQISSIARLHRPAAGRWRRACIRALWRGERRAHERGILPQRTDQRRPADRDGGNRTTGQPLLNYDAVYPVGHPQAGAPVLKILQGSEIVRSDLNAIITGPARGNFPAGTYPPNPTLEPNASAPQAPGLPLRPREEPFREFTIIFHDEIVAVQAFPACSTTECSITAAAACRTPSPSTTAPAASAPRSSPTALGVGPHVRLRRVQVRGVLPQLLGGRRSGHGRRRAGQCRP